MLSFDLLQFALKVSVYYRGKLLEIMNVIFGKGEVRSDFMKTKHLYTKGCKRQCVLSWGISLVSVEENYLV